MKIRTSKADLAFTLIELLVVSPVIPHNCRSSERY